jgi:hypothetical protein
MYRLSALCDAELVALHRGLCYTIGRVYRSYIVSRRKWIHERITWVMVRALSVVIYKLGVGE